MGPSYGRQTHQPVYLHSIDHQSTSAAELLTAVPTTVTPSDWAAGQPKMERTALVDADYHRAFLLGRSAIAADALLVFLMAGVVALNSPPEWDASIYIELATCALGLVGLACSGVAGAGLYVRGVAPHAAFALVLGAVMAADAATRVAFGVNPRRVASNWAVMLASGSSCNLLAMGPMARATDARRWTLAWLAYQVLECYVSLFGACTSWRLVLTVLVVRRLAFVAATALVAVHSYGSLKRTQALFRAFDAPFILAPIGALGAYEDGTYELYDDLPQEELACVGGAFLLKFQLHGGYAPCPPDPNPIVFLEQMLSFGSPTSVVGARAAAGHVVYVAGMLRAVGAARGVDVERYASQRERARRVMGEWLCGSREAATELSASRDVSVV